jgi:preprotein translocase subunit SecF
MSLNVAIALMVGCVLGVFSTILLVGLAFAVREHKQNKKEETHE